MHTAAALIWYPVMSSHLVCHAVAEHAHAYTQNGVAFEFCCQTAEEICSAVRLQIQRP